MKHDRHHQQSGPELRPTNRPTFWAVNSSLQSAAQKTSLPELLPGANQPPVRLLKGQDDLKDCKSL